jgi:hypothetical protein
MKRVNVFIHLTGYFHEQTCRDVGLTKENYDQINYYPVVLQNLSRVFKHQSAAFLTVVFDREPNNDTADEKLQVAEQALSRCPLYSIDVDLPIRVDVIRSVKSHHVRETMLCKQHVEDEGALLLCLNLLCISCIMREVVNPCTNHDLHLKQTLGVIHKVCVLHLVQDIALCLPLLVQLKLGDFSNHASAEPLDGVFLSHEQLGLFILFQLVLDVKEVCCRQLYL